MKRQHFLALGRHRIYLNCIEGANYMEQRQCYCNKCNFIFDRLNTFHTHMKRQHFLALDGLDTELQSLSNCFEGANCMKQKQFNCNKCNSTCLIINTFNTHTKRQHYISLEDTESSPQATVSRERTTRNKSNLIATKAILYLKN